jgi:serine phosphatase RsbU (regulator of sigma subunit)
MAEEERLLKEKAILLMARERELTALRKKHDRADAWLAVAHGLPQIAGALRSFAEIYQQFADSLISALQLQAVGFHELGAHGTLVPVLRAGNWSGAEPRALAAGRALVDRGAGLCNAPADDATRDLAEVLGLWRFLWYRIDHLAGPPLLVTMGYDRERSAFYAAFDESDAARFTSVGNHLKALLGNMYLVRELETDKRALQEFNQALELRVAERTKELHERNNQLAHLLGSLRDKEQRITDDLEQARAFQQSILPTLPTSPKAAVHAYFRPLELVGGDIYDVCQLSENHFRVFIADATGHGVQAAMRTIVLKAEYDRLKYEIGNPAALLETFNRNLVTLYSRSEMLCTACCVDVVVHEGGARVRYANAAQPAIVRMSGDHIEQVESEGPFMGLTKDTEVPLSEFEAGTGERILIYTDGLSDQLNTAGATFDLTAELRAHAGLPLSSLFERITEAFDAFRGECTTADDITLVGIEVGGGLRSTSRG